MERQREDGWQTPSATPLGSVRSGSGKKRAVVSDREPETLEHLKNVDGRGNGKEVQSVRSRSDLSASNRQL